MTWLASEYLARLAVPSDMQDSMAFLYREVLLAARGPGRPVIAEFGVRTGNSTCCFLAGLEEAGSGSLWSVDVRQPDVPAEFRVPAWHLLVTDGLSDVARAWVPPDLDLLFIDTSHTYEQTAAELAGYVPRVRPGGTVLLHDTQWSPSGPLPGPDGPVAQALSDYCAGAGLAWSNHESVWGLGVVRVPAA